MMTGAHHSSSVRPPPAAAGMAILAGVVFVWVGMILGVSFLATSAKFLAPSLSLAVALDVGRHTFEIFLGFEVAWALLIAALLVLLRPGWLFYLLAGISVAIVALDILWLRPVLDARVQIILDGGSLQPAQLHSLYIVLELVKVFALIALGALALVRLSAMAGYSQAGHG